MYEPVVDWNELRTLGGIVLVVAALILAVWYTISHSSQSTLHSNPVDMSDKQQLVFEHTNYDGSIVVYCDIPSMDRVYVMKGQTPVVEKGGCSGLP